MAESTSKGIISRQALGRIARLGDLYDARTDTFCGTTVFKQQLPSDSPAVVETKNHGFYTSVTIVSSLKEKLKILDVKGDLKLSAVCGMFELGGSGKYLFHKKDSFKSVESILLCKVTTVQERLEIFDTHLKPNISLDALRRSTATHVVVKIDWGANCAITITDQNSENKKKQEVEGNLMQHLEKFKSIVLATVEGRCDLTEEENVSCNKFSLEIFGDVLPDEFPHTVDSALSMMRNMKQLVQKCNDEKGKPLTYFMLPLSSPDFQKFVDMQHFKARTIKNLDEGQIIQVIQLLDHITELRQALHDQVVEINEYSHCLTSSELEEARSIENSLEVQQGTAKSGLEQHLQKLRSVNNDGQILESFCDEHRATANDKFRKCQNIYRVMQSRTEFAKRCKKFGARYMQPPVNQRIASACDDYENVYVLLDGQADAETTEKNQSAFIELAKTGQFESKTACYFTWTDSTGDVRIEHYRKNKRVHADVGKVLATKNVAQCVPATRRALRLIPFKVRCPGSYDRYCSREELSWTCINCDETLQFCPYDRAIYCSCGQSRSVSVSMPL